MMKKNRKAVVEMVGLIMILFSVTIGGVLLSKYTRTVTSERTVEYREAYETYNDQLGAEHFYKDMLQDELRDTLIGEGYDLNKFCPWQVYEARIEMGDKVAALANKKLANLNYRYKTYVLPRLRVFSVGQTDSRIEIELELESPLSFAPYAAEHRITALSNPVFKESIPKTSDLPDLNVVDFMLRREAGWAAAENNPEFIFLKSGQKALISANIMNLGCSDAAGGWDYALRKITAKWECNDVGGVWEYERMFGGIGSATEEGELTKTEAGCTDNWRCRTSEDSMTDHDTIWCSAAHDNYYCECYSDEQSETVADALPKPPPWEKKPLVIRQWDVPDRGKYRRYSIEADTANALDEISEINNRVSFHVPSVDANGWFEVSAPATGHDWELWWFVDAEIDHFDSTLETSVVNALPNDKTTLTLYNDNDQVVETFWYNGVNGVKSYSYDLSTPGYVKYIKVELHSGDIPALDKTTSRIVVKKDGNCVNWDLGALAGKAPGYSDCEGGGYFPGDTVRWLDNDCALHAVGCIEENNQQTVRGYCKVDTKQCCEKDIHTGVYSDCVDATLYESRPTAKCIWAIWPHGIEWVDNDYVYHYAECPDSNKYCKADTKECCTTDVRDVCSDALGFADTDGDGWTDFDEINVHGTDPNNPDTDGDGIIDSVDPEPLVPDEGVVEEELLERMDEWCDWWCDTDEGLFGTYHRTIGDVWWCEDTKNWISEMPEGVSEVMEADEAAELQSAPNPGCCCVPQLNNPGDILDQNQLDILCLAACVADGFNLGEYDPYCIFDEPCDGALDLSEFPNALTGQDCCCCAMCPGGEIPDCNGNCCPERWLGDGYCDDGTWNHNGIDIYLNCEDWDNDNGDCDEEPSTCPMLYSWDGHKFAFQGDTSIGGSTGFGPKSKNEKCQKPQPLDYTVVNGLEPREGSYELVVGEEQAEIVYFDSAKLLAIDHEPGVKIFSPTPVRVAEPYIDWDKFKIHTVKELRPPASATDENGADILEQIKQIDNLHTIAATEYHHDQITLDLGDLSGAPQVKLIIKARNTFITEPPQDTSFIEVINEKGEFERVKQREDSFPEWTKHNTRTFVIDITDYFLTDDYTIRLNLWHKTFIDYLAVDTSQDTELCITELKPKSAELFYKGISADENGIYDYHTITDTSFSYFTGKFTKYGDVLELARETDDKFVISNPGDAINIKFDAVAEQDGLERSYIFVSDAFYKMDFVKYLTGQQAGSRVTPLPFHEMDCYPYEEWKYKNDEAYQEYMNTWNTREITAQETETGILDTILDWLRRQITIEK